MKSLKKLLIGLFALSALSVIFVSCPNTPEENISVEKVTFSLAEGKVESGSSLSLSCATDGAVIYYSINSQTDLNSSNFASVGQEYINPISLTQNTAIKAIAVFTSSATGKIYTSEVSSANYTIPAVPELTISTTATPDSDGNYAANTLFTISQKSEEPNDSVTIYYSTSTALTSENAESSGTVYEANETDTTNLTLKEILNISAIAKGNNGWSRSASLTAKIPITYQKGAYEFDGGIKAAIEEIDKEPTGATFAAKTLSGIVTRASKGSVYIQDKDSGIQLYNSNVNQNNEYVVGDYVTVSNATKGSVFGLGGTAQISNAITLVKDESKAKRIIYFKEIPSYVKDFTPYVENTGNTILYGFRGTASEHTVAPDLIYGVSDANKSSEKIHIGVAVNSSSGGIELSVWNSLDADDKILAKKDTPANYIVAPRFSPNGGYISSGDTVTLTKVYPENSEIYFKFIKGSEKPTVDEIKSGTKYDTSNQDSGVPKITENGTLYALAVSGTNVSNVVSAKFTVIAAGSDYIDFKTQEISTPTEIPVGSSWDIGNYKFETMKKTVNKQSYGYQLYKNSSVKISNTTGKKIKEIVFTVTEEKYGKTGTADNGTLTAADTSNLTVKWTPKDGISVDSVTITASVAQWRFKNMIITTE